MNPVNTSDPKRTFGLFPYKKAMVAKRKRGAKVGSANMALNGIKKLEKLGVLK